MEILHSDQGQLAWTKGHAHGVHEGDLRGRNVIPADVLSTLPDPNILASAVAPSADQLAAAKTLITEGWMQTVGVAVPTPAP
jgi:hypothetical protein